MCIIVAHPTGVRLPTEDEIKNCYDSNRNGAGMAFINKETGQVRIEKGFFDFDKFLARYKSLELSISDPFLLHFRIATQGLVDKGNCHPFPITKRIPQLRSTQIETDIAVTHNGILWSNKNEKKLSDTMEYIRDFLAEECIRQNLRNYAIEQLLLEYGGTYNKFAFLHAENGEIVTFGKFEDEDGLKFSNKDYIDYKSYSSYGVGGCNWGSGLPSTYTKNDPDDRIWCDFCGYTAIKDTIEDVDGYTMCGLCQRYEPKAEFYNCKKCGKLRHKHSLSIKDICVVCDPAVEPDSKIAKDKRAEKISGQMKFNLEDTEATDDLTDENECEICGLAYPMDELLDFGLDATTGVRMYMCNFCYDDIKDEEAHRKLEDQPLTAKDYEDDYSGPIGVA